MGAPAMQLSLQSLAQMCRKLHAAAMHEAALAESLAGLGERCAAGAALWRSYNNVLGQLKSQVSHPFVAGIPEAGDGIEAITLPILTSQLLGAVLALAAPTMTPEAVAHTWDETEDRDYDAL